MGEVHMSYVKSEPEFHRPLIQHEELHMCSLAPPGFGVWPRADVSEDNRKSDALSPELSNTGLLEQREPVLEGTSFSVPPICPAPLCRQFWKAGSYNDVFASKPGVQNSRNHMHVHPKFLHSNATSHTWAFGAMAELLDNTIDEIPNGASYVVVDKITNRRDGSPALLIQDDGRGMDPEAIRRCMSFGFSDKQSTSSIGRYGNGFKTSTMRLGADAIVFSRHMDYRNRTLTQSIGLLSYTYLSRTGLDRIVVPMVDYEYNVSTNSFEPLHRYGGNHFQSNISIITQWSPYTTEAELMKQFDDIGSHGTKVIVFNLWLTDEETLELDFESDPEDIRLRGSEKSNPHMVMSEEHIGNQYHYSFRVYLSILYLRIPHNFSIMLRGKVVEHHSIARDLKYPEFILYKPQTAGTKEGEVLTTIGFLKEAPHVNVHGFNVYHKNRLILPFWQVVNYSASRGRGVVGLLEANFIEPMHNKQDFERTSIFQKLETRLKDMTFEYWDYHCGLIGYQVQKRVKVPVSLPGSSYASTNSTLEPVISSKKSNLGSAAVHQADPVDSSAAAVVQNAQSSIQQHGIKRTQDDSLSALGRGLKKAKLAASAPNAGHSTGQPSICVTKLLNQQEPSVHMQENKKLRAKCLEHEKAETELTYRVSRLEKEIEEAQHEYRSMLCKLSSIEAPEAQKYGVLRP